MYFKQLQAPIKVACLEQRGNSHHSDHNSAISAYLRFNYSPSQSTVTGLERQMRTGSAMPLLLKLTNVPGVKDC